MNFNVLSKLGRVLVMGVVAASLISCEKDEDVVVVSHADADQYFNVALSTSPTGTTEHYSYATSTPMTGNISLKMGYEVPSSRTARLFASGDGKEMYSLDYGGGTITKFDVLGGNNYQWNDLRNIATLMGSEYPRWTVMNEESALLHRILTTRMYNVDANMDSTYTHTKSEAYLLGVDLESFDLGKRSILELPAETEVGVYVGRIDAPVVVGGKAYYGVSKSKYDAATDDNVDGFVYKASTLVVDYPALTNPTMLYSDVTTGSTQGYRVPVQHVDENNDIYQITRTGFMLKITDGAYDNDYVFNLSTAAGSAINTLGWFYAGNGIGYATYYDSAKGSSSEEAAWGILRVDVRTKTAIKMNISGLYLFQYQMAKVVDGKVYMALAPLEKSGNIYIFDSKKADANGFEIGATLESGAGISYVGIF